MTRLNDPELQAENKRIYEKYAAQNSKKQADKTEYYSKLSNSELNEMLKEAIEKNTRHTMAVGKPSAAKLRKISEIQDEMKRR